MNEPADKKLGDIGEIELGPDARQRRSQQAARPVEPPTGGVRAGQGINLWFLATVLLAVLVALMSAWFFRELGSLKVQVESTLTDSSRQLGDLASQLSATDESLNQSSDQIADTLKLHDSEIRKLWGVSNDRNKQWIQDLQGAVGTLEKQRAQLGKSVDALRAEMKALQGSVQKMEVVRNQLQTRIELMRDTVQQLEGRVAAQQKTAQALERIQPQLDAVAQLQAQGEGLGVRLAEIEAAINAVDAYRREVNVRLDKLEGRSP